MEWLKMLMSHSTRFSGTNAQKLYLLELGVSSAVVAFNEGARGLCKVIEKLGIKKRGVHKVNV